MKQTAVIFYFFIASYMMLSSCDSIMQKNYEFYYYPSRNIYYNVSNKEYIYSLNGGQTWDSVFFSTGTPPPTLGNKRILHSQSPDIWLNNAVHIQQYNGQVINIAAIDSSSSQQGFVADRNIKKAVKPVTTQNKDTEKKPGFFKRLFSKKNK